MHEVVHAAGTGGAARQVHGWRSLAAGPLVEEVRWEVEQVDDWEEEQWYKGEGRFRWDGEMRKWRRWKTRRISSNE